MSRFLPSLPALVALFLLTGTRSPCQETPIVPDTASSGATTPASDKEETGALTDILPDRVEPLTLPAENAEEHALSAGDAGSSGASLFPAELWPSAPSALPDPPDLPPAVETAGIAAASEPLPPDVAASCFGAGPPPPLHDPQHLLATAQTAPLLALVRDSINARGGFQTSIIVLKGNQQIPISLDPSDLLHRWHGETRSVLILYFLGQAERTQAFFSPETRKYHRDEDLRQVIDFGVREAARMASPVQQLQRFCYKTAIRLDRLHRQGIVTPSEEAPAVAYSQSSTPSAGLWWAFAVGVQAAGLAAGAVWWWRRRSTLAGASLPSEIILLPDQDVIPRLGAPHSGGAGAFIQFGSAGHRL